MTTEQLPLPDYDHLTLPALTSRVRALDAGGVSALLAYEQEHGDRLPGGARPARAARRARGRRPAVRRRPGRRAPGPAPPAAGGSEVSPATTDAPKINPPSQGVPTNPSQPRSTG